MPQRQREEGGERRTNASFLAWGVDEVQHVRFARSPSVKETASPGANRDASTVFYFCSKKRNSTRRVQKNAKGLLVHHARIKKQTQRPGAAPKSEIGRRTPLKTTARTRHPYICRTQQGLKNSPKESRKLESLLGSIDPKRRKIALETELFPWSTCATMLKFLT